MCSRLHAQTALSTVTNWLGMYVVCPRDGLDVENISCGKGMWRYSDRCFMNWAEYRGAGKSLARRGRKQVNVSARMAWISFGALPCREKKKLMAARVSMLLKSRPSLTCFLVCFLPGGTKDLSAQTGTQRITVSAVKCHLIFAFYLWKIASLNWSSCQAIRSCICDRKGSTQLVPTLRYIKFHFSSKYRHVNPYPTNVENRASS